VRIAELIAFQVRIPLRRPIRHASHSRDSTDNIVVQCTLVDGTVGWGEGVPREYVTGETAESATALLRRSNLGDQLGQYDDFAAVVRAVESIRLAPVENDSRCIAGNAARCSLELAILDAYGRYFRQPLSTVTGLIAPELHQPRESVRYSGAITSSDGLKLKAVAWLYRIFGFEQVKVKVGIAGQNDAARLRAIRSRLSNRVELRVDANEAWEPSNVVDKIRELSPFGIASVEQPIRHCDLASLAASRRQIDTPIMLDESLCSINDAEIAAKNGYCDRFNLRLSKCGGLIATLRLAQFARRNGIDCQLGCQVGETGILSAAGRHFASSVGPLTAIEGSFDRHLVRERLSIEDITFRRGGWAPALAGPGLGITIDPKAVERVTIAKEPLLG